MKASTTRARGLAAWSPQRKTRELLANVRSVLLEYADYLPLTVRQIFYRLVGSLGYDKSELAYDRLGEHLNRARRAGLIPFDAIRDDGITTSEPLAWDGAGDLVRTFVQHAGQFRLDRQTGQPAHLLFAVEAAGMLPQVERIADPFGIAVQSCGGFDSTTAKYKLAAKLGHWPRAEVLHIGDHDPSGVHMFSSIAEDVQTFARDLGLGGSIRFTRLAVTPSQIDELGLVTAPAKTTDKRSFTGGTTQCEAIAPDVLAGIIRTAIERRLDEDAYAAVLKQEETTRARLNDRLRPLLLGFRGRAVSGLSAPERTKLTRVLGGNA